MSCRHIVHPLLNPDSASHYDDGETTAIEALEREATVAEQIGWCKGNLFKYRWRMNKKGEAEKDRRKIETYEAYLKLLEWLGPHRREMTVKEAYRSALMRVEYRLP